MKKKLSRKKAKPEGKKLTWKKIWWFIWEDDSWASWFVNVILAFVIIKFLVYLKNFYNISIFIIFQLNLITQIIHSLTNPV